MKEQETKELPKVFYTVEEFHRAIGGIVTKTQIYRLINSGQIPARRFGSKVSIFQAQRVRNEWLRGLKVKGVTSISSRKTVRPVQSLKAVKRLL